VDEKHEDLRQLTSSLPITEKRNILINMKSMFAVRAVRCQTLSVQQEVELYPLLTEPYVVSAFINYSLGIATASSHRE
jgi:hypothetical protein